VAPRRIAQDVTATAAEKLHGDWTLRDARGRAAARLPGLTVATDVVFPVPLRAVS
jgi:hypothetical protein